MKRNNNKGYWFRLGFICGGLAALGIGFIIFLLLTATAEAAFVKSGDGLHVRESPSIESRSLTILPYATEVEVESINNPHWMKTTYNNKTAYICSDYLMDGNPNDDMQYLGYWRITAYAETGYCCANGNYPSVGYTIACNSLPFGTKVWIQGVGVRTVEDRGPTYLGDSWCDLYLGDYSSCVAWGDQYRDVYLMK